MDICIRLGKRIRSLRRARGWRQIDLAAHAELSKTHVCELELGKREVGIRALERMVGTLFRTGSGLWRCTDVDKRTIPAIHLEQVEVNRTNGRRTLKRQEADAEGLFKGPPYIVVEHVFDQ